jgi:hypothetical protein
LETISEHEIAERQRQETPVSYAFSFLNNPETQRQYPRRLKLLFDCIGLNTTVVGEKDPLEAQGRAFMNKTRKNPQWAQDKIIEFVNFQKLRVQRKELAAGTLNKYFIAIKFFCDMNDITTINWKRLSKVPVLL